jgi:hypothetical protein
MSKLRSALNARPFIVQADEEGVYVVDTSQQGDDDAMMIYVTKDEDKRKEIAFIIEKALNDWYGLKGAHRGTLRRDAVGG